MAVLILTGELCPQTRFRLAEILVLAGGAILSAPAVPASTRISARLKRFTGAVILAWGHVAQVHAGHLAGALAHAEGGRVAGARVEVPCGGGQRKQRVAAVLFWQQPTAFMQLETLNQHFIS